MADPVLPELEQQTAAWANLTRQLAGMEPYLERSDAPGEWTTREVLSHLLSAPGRDLAARLRSFSEVDPPLVEIEPGRTDLDDARRRMTLREFVEALDGQRRQVFADLATLADGDLERRKARIPLFKRFVGTDEVSLARFVGAMFGFHWNDHAGQLAKIRAGVGLPAAT